jgi:PAS domain S-box-containing protein
MFERIPYVIALFPEGCYTCVAMAKRSRSRSLTPDAQLLGNLFGTSPIGIAVENMDGKPLFINPAFCAFLGFSNEQLRRKHCVDFSPPEDAEKDWVLFQQLRAGAIDHYQLEKRYFRRDGSLVWGRLSVSSMCDRSVPLILATVEDITDKKQAEEAVHTSEERLRLAQKAARIGTFEWNIQTGVNTWNSELEIIYGLPRGAFFGTQGAFEDLLYVEDRGRVKELIETSMRNGQPTQGEWRVVWPDGSIHWIAGRWQVFMDDAGKPHRMIGVNIDIAERKRAEQALLEMNRMLEANGALLKSREELLRIFVKNVPAGVAMLDQEMRYIQVSDRWCADYGLDSSQILGRSHYELFPDIPASWRAAHRRALDMGEILHADEDRWDRPNGITTWVRWEIRPWKTSSGAIGGILIFAENITERKKVEEVLANLPRRLIEAHEEERTWLARELHDDVNQRLALALVELDRWKEQLPNSAVESHDRIGQLQLGLSNLASDIEALSHRLHSSKLEYLGIVTAARSLCNELSDQQNVEIDFSHKEVPQSMPKEVSLCLFRILQESLRNAVKHSGVRHFTVELCGTAGEIQLTVSDLGVGFDPQHAIARRGLGLTSMRERLQLVKGQISIQSRLGTGTRIHARIPCTSESESIRRRDKEGDSGPNSFLEQV